MTKGLLGRKLGMTQVFTADGRAVPVTVVAVEPNVVVTCRTVERDGYSAVQVGFGAVHERRLSSPRRGHFRRAGVTPVRYLREFRWPAAELPEVGSKIGVDLFSDGDLVDVTGTSKGKGFAGGVRRWGFSRGPMGHGSKYHRSPGSLQSRAAARVFPGRKMPGHLGAVRVTVRRLHLERVDADRNLLLIRGAIPGVRGAVVAVRPAR